MDPRIPHGRRVEMHRSCPGIFPDDPIQHIFHIGMLRHMAIPYPGGDRHHFVYVAHTIGRRQYRIF